MTQPTFKLIRCADVIVEPDRVRHEEYMGDLAAFARLLARRQLHPIGIDSNYVLLWGERRLRAIRDVLGREFIEAKVIPAEGLSEADRLALQGDENVAREQFRYSERVELAALTPSLYRSGQRIVRDGVPELVALVDSGKVRPTLAAEVAGWADEWQLKFCDLASHPDANPADIARQVREYIRQADGEPDPVPSPRAPSQPPEPPAAPTAPSRERNEAGAGLATLPGGGQAEAEEPAPELAPAEEENIPQAGEYSPPQQVVEPLLDALGLPVAEWCKAAFDPADLREFDEIRNAIHAINRRFTALSEKPAGYLLLREVGPTRRTERDGRQKRAIEALEQFLMWLSCYRPHVRCPYCHYLNPGHVEAACGGCHGKGWVTKGTWDAAPPDYKAAVLRDLKGEADAA